MTAPAASREPGETGHSRRRVWRPARRAGTAVRFLLWCLRHPGRLCYRERILIVGLPKTGTTALYFSIRKSLPFARSDFEPTDLTQAVARAHRPYVMKYLLRAGSDDPITRHLARFSRRLLLVRDPRDRMVSSQLYHLFHAGFVDEPEKRARLLALLEAKERDPASIPFKRICAEVGALGGIDYFQGVVGTAQVFDRFVAAWGEQFERVRYEDFVAGGMEALRDYLGLPLPPAATRDPSARRVLRTGGAGDWRNWLTASDVAVLRPQLRPFLERLGYADDWQLAEPQHIDPAHGSAYVRRLLRERDAEGAVRRAAG